MRNGLRPRPDMPDIPGDTEKTDGNRNGAQPPKNNKPRIKSKRER